MANGIKIDKANDIECDKILSNFQQKKGELLQISCENNYKKPILNALRFQESSTITDIQPQNHLRPRNNSESKPEVIKPKLKKSNSLTRYFSYLITEPVPKQKFFRKFF